MSLTRRPNLTDRQIGLPPVEIKAEITLHYNGPSGEVWCGYRVRDVLADDLLAMGAFPVRGPRLESRDLRDVVMWVEGLVLSHLGPF